MQNVLVGCRLESQFIQHDPLRAREWDRSQSDWPVVIQLAGGPLLGDRDDSRRLPVAWCTPLQD